MKAVFQTKTHHTWKRSLLDTSGQREQIEKVSASCRTLMEVSLYSQRNACNTHVYFRTSTETYTIPFVKRDQNLTVFTATIEPFTSTINLHIKISSLISNLYTRISSWVLNPPIRISFYTSNPTILHDFHL